MVIDRKPKGYWNLENTIKELKEVIKELRVFPAQNVLIPLGKSSLLSAMNKNGGINYFRKLWWAIKKHGGFLKFKKILNNIE